ncbi:hypothetical protein [Desulfosarcina ovata]|nr:hypothetical protein [Desulfosarcina ovata]
MNKLLNAGLAAIMIITLASCVNNSVLKDSIVKLPKFPGLPGKSMVDETDVSQSSIAQTDIFQSDPQRIRSTSELSRLFSKGTVNGEELINELLAIQAASRAADTQKAFNNLMGAVDKTKINLAS